MYLSLLLQHMQLLNNMLVLTSTSLVSESIYTHKAVYVSLYNSMIAESILLQMHNYLIIIVIVSMVVCRCYGMGNVIVV